MKIGFDWDMDVAQIDISEMDVERVNGVVAFIEKYHPDKDCFVQGTDLYLPTDMIDVFFRLGMGCHDIEVTDLCPQPE